jgi:hypothetical protein
VTTPDTGSPIRHEANADSSPSSFMRRAAFVAFVALAGAAALFGFYAREFVCLNEDVAMHAEPARRLVEGRGLTTEAHWPMETPYLPKEDGARPTLYFSYLGQPYFLAVPMLFGARSDQAIMVFSSLVYLLAAWPLFLLTRRVFGPASAAVATMAYAVYPALVRVGYQGFHQTPFVLLALWGVYALVRCEKRPALGATIAGLLFSAGGYFREEAYLLLVGAVFFWLMTYGPRRTLALSVLIAAAFLAAGAPKYVYFYSHFRAGAPPHGLIHLLNYWAPYDNWIVQNMTGVPSPAEMLRLHPQAFVDRAFKLLGWSLVWMGKNYWPLIVLGAAGLAAAWREASARRLALVLAAVTVMNIGLYGVVAPLERYFQIPAVYLLPLAACGAVALWRRLGRRAFFTPAVRKLVVGLAVVGVVALVAVPFASPRQNAENALQRRSFRYHLERLRQALPADAPIITAMPAQLTWYLERPTLGLPRDLDTLRRLRGRGYERACVLLSDWYRARDDLFDPAYKQAYRERTPLDGLQFVGAFARIDGQASLWCPR